MEREVGGGIGVGNTCKPMTVSFQCMTKSTTIKKKKKKKEPPVNAGDVTDAGSVPGLGRSSGEEHGNPFQYFCLENPMDRGAYSPWGHKELNTTEAT